MRISAKTDYAARACLELASRRQGEYVKAETIADAQAIPGAFVLGILNQLKRAGLVEAKRGLEGGYRLAVGGDQISIADVMRAADGPLASMQGTKMEDVDYEGSATYLRHVWVALRTAMRGVLEEVTLADVVAGDFPPEVERLLSSAGAWLTRPFGMDVEVGAAPAPRDTSDYYVI